MAEDVTPVESPVSPVEAVTPVEAPVADVTPIEAVAVSSDPVEVSTEEAPETDVLSETPTEIQVTNDVTPVADELAVAVESTSDLVEVVITEIVNAAEAADPEVPAHVEIAYSVIPAQFGLPEFPL